MLEKKCMKFFKYFFTLKNSGLGSGSASVFKTLDLDPDPQEMDADPKPWLKLIILSSRSATDIKMSLN